MTPEEQAPAASPLTGADRGDAIRRGMCPECGQPGPYLVPPSFGDSGLWMCTGRWDE